MPPDLAQAAVNASAQEGDRPSGSTAAGATDGAAAASKQAAQHALSGIAALQPRANGEVAPARADVRGGLSPQQNRAPAAPAARALGGSIRNPSRSPAAASASAVREAALQERAGGNSGDSGAAARGDKAAPAAQRHAHSSPQKENAASAGRLPSGGMHARHERQAHGGAGLTCPRSPAHTAAPAGSPRRAHAGSAPPATAAGARTAELRSREPAPHVGQQSSGAAAPGEGPAAGAADAPGAAAAAKKKRRRRKPSAVQCGAEPGAAAGAPGAGAGEGAGDAECGSGAEAAAAEEPASQQGPGSGAGDSRSASAVQAADLRDRTGVAAAAGEHAVEQGPAAEGVSAGALQAEGPAADAQQAEEAPASAQGAYAEESAAGFGQTGAAAAAGQGAHAERTPADSVLAEGTAADAKQAAAAATAGAARTTLGRDAAGAWEGLAGLRVRWALARERKLGEDASCQHAANTWAHPGLAGVALFTNSTCTQYSPNPNHQCLLMSTYYPV